MPEYSMMNLGNEMNAEEDGLTKEAFDEETREIFQQQPRLLGKLQKLQTVMQKFYEIINGEKSEIRVSFFVFESISKLANMDIVSEWRGLEMLRPTRNFNPNND